MVKGVNKLSRPQKSVLSKSQKHISSFFAVKSVVPDQKTTMVASGAPQQTKAATSPAKSGGGGGGGGVQLVSPRRPADACRVIGVNGEHLPRPETFPKRLPSADRLTSIVRRGGGGDAGPPPPPPPPTPDGALPALRLTKRPVRPAGGASPRGKRPTGAAGLLRTEPGSGRAADGGTGTASGAAPPAAVRDLGPALDRVAAAGVAGGQPAAAEDQTRGGDIRSGCVGSPAADGPLPAATGPAAAGWRERRTHRTPQRSPAADASAAADPSERGLSREASASEAVGDPEPRGADLTAGNQTPRTPPPSGPRSSTPEQNESNLLFDSVDDLDFSSPFKEEATTRAPPPPLRSADLDVPKWRRFDRYRVEFVERRTDGSTVVSLEATELGRPGRTITLRGPWASTSVQPDDVVHVLAAPGDVIDGLAGQLVVNPDRLVSGTSVVSAVFCARKAVLNERFRGLEAGSKVMLVGTLVHQLFQEVMRSRLRTAGGVRSAAALLLRQPSNVSAAYGTGLSGQQLADELEPFVEPILSWVRRYAAWGRDAEVAPPLSYAAAGPAPAAQDNWDGKISALRDIEENYWSPRLGMNGKIDLTVEVSCKKRPSQVMPLELKTGRASFSAEHQGQVTLYTMMTSERRDDPGAGLLLYLRTGAMREVASGQHQQRDLLLLRNRLVEHLIRPPRQQDGQLRPPELPPADAGQWACRRCPHLLACAAYQRPGDAPHPVPDAGGHLSAAHLEFFLQWSLLLQLEAAAGADRAAMNRLWCRTPAERQARGQALAACRLLGVERAATGAWLHRLSRPAGAAAGQLAVGDLVMVSTDRELALASGPLAELTGDEARVLLERDLTAYPDGAGKLYHVDKCEYQQETSMGTYFSSLARLLEDTDHSRRIRELLVDRRPPSFLPGLGRVVITKCRSILRPLNKLQQRALLKVLMAEDYLLICGMPGTGKTSTIVALVRLLVTMGSSVLLASYTNSAVDTVLLKLKEHFTDFVRLGRTSRVHPELLPFCSERAAETHDTPERLAAFFENAPVVATTCLGINHPIFQRRKFDICIIDEASQIVLPAALGPLLLAGRFVLVGDPRQLPPVVQSAEARRRRMDESLFTWLAAGDNTVELTVQYRMNRTLTAAANHLTYEGRLTGGSKAVDLATLPSLERKPEDPVWLRAALEPALELALLLIDTSELAWRHAANRHGEVANGGEAALVASIASALVERGLPADSVGVIAPYRGQVKLLRSALPCPLEVNTVDQYQGRDKSAIIYSCTRTAPKRSDGEAADSADILCDERRLTVAVTRARHKLVLVGRRDVLVSYAPFRRLFGHLGPEHVLRLTPGQVSGLGELSSS